MTDEYTIDAFLEEQDREREQRRFEEEREQALQSRFGDAEEGSPLVDGDDLLLFAPRAAEGFVRSIGSLLPGLDFDDNRWFGRSDTFVGGALEAMTQFGIAMVPGAGVARGAAALAKAGKLGQTLASAHKISQTVGGLKGGRFLMAASEKAGAGAVADFLAFDGHEANLASVLNSVPQLQAVIPDFLAIDEDDGEYTGRIKNVLEGLGLGAATGVLIEGLKGIKAGRKATEEALGSLDPKQTREVLTSTVDPGRMGEGLGEVEGARWGPSKEQVEEMEFEDALDEVVPEGIAPPRTEDRTLRRVLDSDGVEREVDIAEPLQPGADLSTAISAKPGGREALLREFVQNTEGGDELYKALVERRGMGELSENPRAPKPLTYEEQLEQLVTNEHSNLKTLLADPEKGAAWVIRAFEDIGSLDPPKGVSRAERDIATEAYIRSFDAGLPPEVWTERMIKRTRAGRESVEDIMIHGEAFNKVNAAIGIGLNDTFDQIVRGEITEKTIAEATRLGKGYFDANRELRGLKGAFGEALASVKRWADDSDAATRFARRLFEAHEKGSDTLKKFAEEWKYAQSMGTSREKFVRAKELGEMTVGRQVMNMTTELFINNILGGFKTLAIQPLSGTILSFALPMEQMIGGAISGNSHAVKLAIREMSGYMSGFAESARWAWEATKKGDTIIGGRGLTEDAAQRAWSAGALGTTPGTALGNMLDGLGTAINLPSRLISGADEFTKNMRARSMMQAELYERAVTSHHQYWEQSVNADGVKVMTMQSRPRTQQEVTDFVQTKMQELITDGQMSAEKAARKRAYAAASERGIQGEDAIEKYVNDNWSDHWDNAEGSLVARAEESMKEVTLQTDLDYDDWEGKVDIALRSHPIFKLVVPFYKTPLNSIKFGMQRVDAFGAVNSLLATRFPQAFPNIGQARSRLVKDLMSGDGVRVAQARGRLAAGTSFMTMGIGLASQGVLTGRGPANPDERRTMMDAGWQPYSIKVGDKYVSYARLEPFSQFFGFMADLTDSARLAGEDDNTEFEEVALSFLVALSNNVTQKSFLSGIGAFTAAMGDPTNKMEAFIAQYAGAAVPSNLAQMVTVFGDDAMKDTHGIFERIESRIPGWSEGATPRRNMLGEVMDRSKSVGEESIGAFYGTFVPIAYREVGSDIIRNELADLKHGFSAPRSTVQGIDLRAFGVGGQHAHDRWQELHGVVKIGGKGFRQALSNLIRSPKYRRLPKDLTTTEESPRVGLIRSMLGRYRAKAFEQLLDEYPELARALQEREEAKARAQRGLSAL